MARIRFCDSRTDLGESNFGSSLPVSGTTGSGSTLKGGQYPIDPLPKVSYGDLGSPPQANRMI